MSSKKPFLRAARLPHAVVLSILASATAIGACGTSPVGQGVTPFQPDSGSGVVHDSGKLVDSGHFATDSGSTQPKKLVLTPATATITVTGAAPVTANYTLKAQLASGALVDVAPQSVQFDRPDIATVSTNEPIVATAPSSATLYGGTGTVHAIYKGLEATAQLTVKVAVSDFGPGLSATSPAVLALGGGGGSGQHPGGDSGAGKDGSAKDGAVASDGGVLPPDPTANISPILYPYDKTVWPLGLTSPRIMWNAPKVGDVYRVHYAEQNFTYDGFFTLTALPAQMPLPQAVWDELTASNNAAKGPDPLAFTLSRYDSLAHAAYLTTTQTWTVAPESLRGAIYYWTASENAMGVRVGHVSRFHPGTGSVPQQLDNGECVGCHAVNAQGTVLVGDVDDTAGNVPDGGVPPVTVAPFGSFNNTRAWARFDITQASSPITYQSNKYGADLALTPDGKYLVFGGQTTAVGSKFMSLGDPKTGTVITTSGLDQVTGFDPTTTNMMMPAFAPDGTKLAVIVSPTQNDSFADNVLPQVLTASPTSPPEVLAFLDFKESGPTFAPALNIMLDSTNGAFANLGGTGMAWNGMAYPSFTPASDALAFHVGQFATGCNSFNAGDPNASIACGDLGTDGGDLFIATLKDKTPIRMANADTPPPVSDASSAVEPTFNPVVRGGYSWVVFTSLRAFGNQPWPSDVPTGSGLINAKRRLWVAAVDTTIGTIDPSHPAIYLEGQADTPNMRAFWTLASCIATPGVSAGGLDGGVVADAGKQADASSGDGGTPQCTSGFQCCSGFCEGGKCVDVSVVACVGLGGSCKAAGATCCNPSVVSCLDDSCASNIPK